MNQLAILSGKGGTGKTSITACFATLAKKAVIADCDVDAPDLHMLLHPKIIQTQQFQSSKIVNINTKKCSRCGLCQENCRFDAVSDDFKVDPISCEGCGVCSFICPVNAISLIDRLSGNAYISKTKYGFMSHALLNPGEGNSGKLVTLVRQNAKTIADKKNCEFIIIDGPPGIGCPVIASISGIDACLIVTEPTLSGIHDLERVLELLRHFNVVAFVCVNMYDINSVNTEKISKFCIENQIGVIGKIPFSSTVTKAMVNGKNIVEHSPNSDIAIEITTMWKKIVKLLSLRCK